MTAQHKNAKIAACVKGRRTTQEETSGSVWKNLEILIIEVAFDKILDKLSRRTSAKKITSERAQNYGRVE